MDNKSNIIVFGATGRIGKALLGFLSAAGVPATAITRNKDKAFTLPFITWVEADMNDKHSLDGILRGARSVFLASAMTEGFVQAQGNVIAAADEQGVSFVVKLSSRMADEHSDHFIGRAHGEVEALMKASSIQGVLLRPEGFMQNWLGEAAQTVKHERRIYDGAGDGKRAYIDLRDIAEVAFTVLTQPEKHACHAYELTGDVAVDYHQVASTISRAIGEPVDYVPLTLEETAERLTGRGLPPAMVQTFLSYMRDQRAGKAAVPSTDVRDILGKPARTVEDFIAEHAAIFR